MKPTTALAFNHGCTEHYSLWYPDHIETPDRFSRIFSNVKKHGLLDRCKVLEQRDVCTNEIQLVHEMKHINAVKRTKDMNKDELKHITAHSEHIYFNNSTYEHAIKSIGNALSVVDSVLDGDTTNGMALCRPPGHHASIDRACGFCVFNNCAIAAKYAANKLEASGKRARILIIDWDLHAPQGTHYAIKDDPRILLISIHRFLNGSVWPFLPEMNWDNHGNTINIPINVEPVGDVDYQWLFHHIIMPMAAEFDPTFVLVSAGYDSAYGNAIRTVGDLQLTPHFYAHMTRQLMGLADGRVAVLLEGGYCLTSFEWGVHKTITALLGDPLTPIPPYITELNHAIVDVGIKLATKHAHRFGALHRFVEIVRSAETVQQLTGDDVIIKEQCIAYFNGHRVMDVPMPIKDLYKYLPEDKIEVYTKQLLAWEKELTADVGGRTTKEMVMTVVSSADDNLETKMAAAIKTLTTNETQISIVTHAMPLNEEMLQRSIRQLFEPFQRTAIVSLGYDNVDKMTEVTDAAPQQISIKRATRQQVTIDDRHMCQLQLEDEVNNADLFLLTQHLIVPLLTDVHTECTIVRVHESFADLPLFNYALHAIAAASNSRVFAIVAHHKEMSPLRWTDVTVSLRSSNEQPVHEKTTEAVAVALVKMATGHNRRSCQWVTNMLKS